MAEPQAVAVTGSAPGTIDAALDEYLGQQAAPAPADNVPAPSEGLGDNNAAPEPQSPDPAPDTPQAPDAEPEGGDADPQEPEPVAADAASTITIYPNGPEGGAVEITAEEAQNSYMRQADYTRKTQEVAQQRQEAAMMSQQLVGQRDQYLQGLQAIGQALQSQEPLMPDHSMQEVDPVGYLEQVEQVRSHRDRVQGLQAEYAQASQQQDHARTMAMSDHLQHAKQQLVHVMPELSRDENLKEFVTKNREHMVSNGFTQEEANNVYDWRAAIYIDKARRYDEMMTKSAGKIAAAPRTNTPTIRQSQTTAGGALTSDAAVIRKADQRLTREGSVDAAVDYLIASRGVS